MGIRFFIEKQAESLSRKRKNRVAFEKEHKNIHQI